MSFADDVDAALQALRLVLGCGDPPSVSTPEPVSAAPKWPVWTGTASTAAQRVSEVLDRERQRIFFDRLAAAPIIKHAGDITTSARSQMDGTEAGWQQDKASLAPIAETPLGQISLMHAGQRRLADASKVIREAMNALGSAARNLQAVSADLPLTPPGQPGSPPMPSTADEQRRNQIAAFHQVFGRDPVSESDWETAAALDPHSYDLKNAGVPPNIVVGRITPVPGQGVVRTNLFIPGEKAWTPLGDNLGDSRGFDPNVGPEESRVTIYTDYDNGIVVVRQNPSVLQGITGTDVKAGNPDVRVSQNPNGSVLINYHAADPFSPGGQDLAKSSPFNVNGTLVVKPTAGGPVAGGTVSQFPAIEIYNDNGGHTIEMAKIMPQNTGPFGPIAGLPFSQEIGRPGLVGGFPDTIAGPAPAPVPAPHAPSGPPPVVQIPVPVVIPYPSVQLGSVSDIPQVPVGH